MLTRAWYHCGQCGHGLAPRDAELGVAGASMSPGLAAMNDQAAAAGPFAKAAELPAGLAGAQLTVRRVESSAEASGTAKAAADRDRAAAIAARQLVPPPTPLPDKLYAAIDGTGVPVTSKETAGRAGKGEDGRARTREVKLAVFFTQDKLDNNGYPVRDRDSPPQHNANALSWVFTGRRRPLADLGHLGEGVAEDIVQDERDALGRGHRFEHYQEGHADRLIQGDAVGRVGAPHHKGTT